MSLPMLWLALSAILTRLAERRVIAPVPAYLGPLLSIALIGGSLLYLSRQDRPYERLRAKLWPENPYFEEFYELRQKPSTPPHAIRLLQLADLALGEGVGAVGPFVWLSAIS